MRSITMVRARCRDPRAHPRCCGTTLPRRKRVADEVRTYDAGIAVNAAAVLGWPECFTTQRTDSYRASAGPVRLRSVK